ncbi:MAG: cytochrome P450 [Deltaproteobacteria bacterium]
MKDSRVPDWDPTADSVRGNQCGAYDQMRRRCPVAYSELLGWSVFRHEDVVHILQHPETFSSAVSQHRSVPSGMDPPEHGAYRRAIEPYFSDERMRSFAPVCRQIARALLEPRVEQGPFDYVEAFAIPFALRCQCAFLGWPDTLLEPIRQWTRKNREATRAGDRSAQAAIAREFRSHIDELLACRRRAGADAPDDVTFQLMQARVNGAALSDDELASILRNWTVGEVESLAAAAGILAQRLASDVALQHQLRAEPRWLPAAIEEILRVMGPLVLNRRLALRDVKLGGCHIRKGDRLSLMWLSANRDERVFESPQEVRLERDARQNLLYGAGIHVCPGAPLARLELQIAMAELLRCSGQIELSGETPGQPATYPANGWLSLALKLVSPDPPVC